MWLVTFPIVMTQKNIYFAWEFKDFSALLIALCSCVKYHGGRNMKPECLQCLVNRKHEKRDTKKLKQGINVIKHEPVLTSFGQVPCLKVFPTF